VRSEQIVVLSFRHLHTVAHLYGLRPLNELPAQANCTLTGFAYQSHDRLFPARLNLLIIKCLCSFQFSMYELFMVLKYGQNDAVGVTERKTLFRGQK
jgi:hypothetical protein